MAWDNNVALCVGHGSKQASGVGEDLILPVLPHSFGVAGEFGVCDAALGIHADPGGLPRVGMRKV